MTLATKVKEDFFKAPIDPLALFDELAFDPQTVSGNEKAFSIAFGSYGFGGKTMKSPL